MQVLNAPPSIGDIINELYLLPVKVTEDEAALLCQISSEEFAKIMQGKTEIGYELAYKLGKGFNTPHTFWLNLQKDYKASLSD